MGLSGFPSRLLPGRTDRGARKPDTAAAPLPMESAVDGATVSAWRAATVVMIALGAAGIILKYSPVPYMDLWDGYVNFYLNALQGNASAWWTPHVDHRIVLSRIIFWLDARYLGGRFYLPLLANFLALIGASALFAWLVRAVAFEGRRNAESTVVACFAAMLAFSYVQQENIVDPFQIQFLLAFLIPLAAFIALANACAAHRSAQWFLAAMALGGLAIGTMANGVIVLPLLAAMAVLARQPRLRIAGLAIASVIGAGAYLRGFSAYGVDGQTLARTIANPIDAGAFSLIYLGAAVGRLFHSKFVAATIGLCALAINALVMREWPRSERREPLVLALLTFFVYGCASAVVTAVGRLQFGLDQAMNERYATPSAYLLAVTTILYFQRRAGPLKISLRTARVMGATALLLVIFQFRALGDRAFENHQRAVAALALVMPDNAAFVDDTLHPYPERLRRFAARAQQAAVSIFSVRPYADTAARLGGASSDIAADACGFTVTEWHEVAPGRFRVSGDLLNPPAGTSRVWFVDAAGRVVGVALPGRPLPKDQDPWWSRRSLDGIDGFALASRAGIQARCEGTAGRSAGSHAGTAAH